MATIIKNTSNYGIYVMESESGSDDWVSDHDDMKEVDISLFTEGTDCLYLPYTGNLRKISQYKVEMIDFFKGEAESVGIGEGHYVFKLRGRFGGTGESNRQLKMANCEEFFKRHLATGDNDIYLGYRKLNGNWEQFVDNNFNHKGYLKGRIINFDYQRETKQLYYQWELIFQEGW